MEIPLDPELQEFIEWKLKSREAHSAAEVVNDALRLMQETEIVTDELIDELEEELQSGIDQINRGEGIPWDPEATRRRMHERLAQLKGAV